MMAVLLKCDFRVDSGADPNVRDYSGRKPRQYQTNQDTSLSADTYRSEYAREKPSAAAKLLLFSSLPRPKRRAKKTANLSSLSFSHAVQVVNPSSKSARDKHCGGGDRGSDSARPSSALYYFSALSWFLNNNNDNNATRHTHTHTHTHLYIIAKHALCDTYYSYVYDLPICI